MERALECRRWESACLAKASGVCAAARPSRDAIARRSVAGLTAQQEQRSRLGLMDFPQPRQRFSVRAAIASDRFDEMPLASRLCVWVKRVGGKSLCVLFCLVDQNCFATHSAIGATARVQNWCRFREANGESAHQSAVTVSLFEKPLPP